MLRIPFVYKKMLKELDFTKEEFDLSEFQSILSKFRISKKDWLTIAKDLNGFGLVDIQKGKLNQFTKISVRRRGRLYIPPRSK